MLYSHLDRIRVLYLLVFVIFLAGCARQTTVAANNGLSIIEFSPDLSVVGSGTPVTISLITENIGEAVATQVTAELIGLDDWTLESARKQSLQPDFLTAADIANNLKGGSGSAEWKLVSPVKQFNQKYDFATKLSYDYQTHSNILFKVINLDYFKSLTKEEQARVQQGIVSVSTTKGPLEVSAKTQQTFITLATELPIEITIKNTGSGRAFLITPEKPNLDKVTLVVQNVKRCGAEALTFYDVRLSNGKIGRIICYLDTSKVSTVKTFSIDITIDYKYFIEKTSSVSVLKAII